MPEILADIVAKVEKERVEAELKAVLEADDDVEPEAEA